MRKDYRELGLESLNYELLTIRTRTYWDDRVAEVVNRAMQTLSTDGNTHWSAQTLTAAICKSKTTVHSWL